MSQTEEITKRHINPVKTAGILLLLTGVVFLFMTYLPVISSYVKYVFFNREKQPEIQLADKELVNTNISGSTDIVFVNKTFGIYIPKIQTNASVIPDVDTTNKSEYLKALEKGIAHAKGTSYPNQHGNVFLFAHSAVDFYNQRNYSVYFYLLGELRQGDKIYISYNDKMYEYSVLETKIVSKTDTKYMGKYLDEDTLTLMSCWPSGTNLKRIIVIAVRN